MPKLKVKPACNCASVIYRNHSDSGILFRGGNPPKITTDPFTGEKVEIDVCLYPVIKRLWRNHVRTSYCCCGHANMPLGLGRPRNLNNGKKKSDKFGIELVPYPFPLEPLENEAHIVIHPEATILDLRKARKIIANMIPEYQIRLTHDIWLNYPDRESYKYSTMSFKWSTAIKNVYTIQDWWRILGIVTHTVSNTDPKKVYRYLEYHGILEDLYLLYRILYHNDSDYPRAQLDSTILAAAVRLYKKK